MIKKKRILSLGLTLAMVVTLVPSNLSNAKSVPSLTGKTTVTAKKTKTLQVKTNGTQIKKVTWKSSNKKIVTVKANGKLKGKITGVKAGKATITASVSYKAGKKSATKKLTCKVTVAKAVSKKVKLNHTYKTRLSKIDKVDCPTFQFKYPDHWKIVKEETHQQGSWAERDVLKNDRGVTITYTDYDSIYGLGGGGRFMYETKFSKVAKSSFVPAYIGTDGERSDIGPCMVAKVKTVGALYMDEDTDFTKIDGGVVYAVVPESYAGMHPVVGLSGLYTACSFEYPSLYSFIAEAPNGRFTKEEEKEVIAILSSFREVFS